ncbi:hypothetical protein HPB50_003975 [Hyalomma asiaticum]|uniref:Uncharacterized protein n=1 Tax=Hyalomma asiaticum TaxID=266040 RepID=A0ACB7T5Z4_HYAAI|nr:hypothetical protein HPB50_003975 [Hyalomma asiaticum]
MRVESVIEKPKTGSPSAVRARPPTPHTTMASRFVKSLDAPCSCELRARSTGVQRMKNRTIATSLGSSGTRSPPSARPRHVRAEAEERGSHGVGLSRLLEILSFFRGVVVCCTRESCLLASA